jgi:MFS family permease
MRLIRRERLAGDLRTSAPGPGYRWIALSNTTLGTLMATINGSIILIALPDIFRGIGVNPLLAGNASLLLWLILGYLLVTAVLVVTFGRLGDMFGRVRIYTLGFAVFTVFSILLGVTWLHGTAGALWLIAMRILQAVGGAMLFANAAAILTDAFPADHRAWRWASTRSPGSPASSSASYWAACSARWSGIWCSWCRCRSASSARSGPTASSASSASAVRFTSTGGGT